MVNEDFKAQGRIQAILKIAYSFLYRPFLFSICSTFLCSTFLPAQPNLSTQHQIHGLNLLEDYLLPDVFYYAPGNISLSFETNGQPRFQLLQMRYTGTACRADQGEVRFTNLVQLTLQMEAHSPALLNKVKTQLGPQAQLRPLPIRNMEAYLVTPIGESPDLARQYQKIGTTGGFESTGLGGNGYWRERTYTLRLDNAEAQLLWDQVTNGKLALSMTYAFYAEVIPGIQGGEVQLSGDSAAVETIKNQIGGDQLIDEGDTLLATHLIHQDAFPVEIDPQQWPETLKQLDINEGVPPAYAALEIKCFDFVDDLRPDLAIKKVEIEATAVNGRPVSLEKQFTRGELDRHTLEINFPYAIRMDRSMRYRVTEFTLAGERDKGPWQEKDPCTGLIDITTAFRDNPIGKKSLEVEANLENLAENGVEQMQLVVFADLGGDPIQQWLDFTPTDPSPIQVLTFRYDLDRPVYYEVLTKHQDGQVQGSGKKMLNTDYLYLR